MIYNKSKVTQQRSGLTLIKSCHSLTNAIKSFRKMISRTRFVQKSDHRVIFDPKVVNQRPLKNYRDLQYLFGFKEPPTPTYISTFLRILFQSLWHLQLA